MLVNALLDTNNTTKLAVALFVLAKSMFLMVVLGVVLQNKIVAWGGLFLYAAFIMAVIAVCIRSTSKGNKKVATPEANSSLRLPEEQ